MNAKHPNLDKIISQVKAEKNGLRKKVDYYDTLKIQQKSGNNVSDTIYENSSEIIAYLRALKDMEFIPYTLWRDAVKEDIALFEEAIWAYKEEELE